MSIITSQSTKDNSLGRDVVPFDNAQEAWFWFVAAQEAKDAGAKYVAGAALYNRPCEPIDILKVVDRLYRGRILLRDHLMVLRHYGVRHMAPDPYRPKEARSAHLWHEAMERMEEVFIRKGIVAVPDTFSIPAYLCDAAMRQQGMRG